MKEKNSRELSGKALRKETIKSCGVKILSRAELAQMIRSKKLDTTIFSSFGAYLGQSAATILATKADDLKNHKLIRTESGEWEIISAPVMGEEKGFCEWSLKRLDETDTRDFFETTNKDGKEPKYVILTYTPSLAQAGEINASGLNPAEGESLLEFKERIKAGSAQDGNDNIAKTIQVNWKEKQKSIIHIPETMFPEIIADGENRTLLISDFYVLDGYVKDYKKMYQYYWGHSAKWSDHGKERPEIDENHCFDQGTADQYDKVEKISEGVYRTYKEHSEIGSTKQNQKCGRIRGDKEREEFAEMVLSEEFYDEGEKNRDSGNIIIAELTYPYIATIKK